MSDRWRVFVYSEDPILHAGTVAQFRGTGNVDVTDDLDEAQVAVLVADEVDKTTVHLCRSLRCNASVGVVVVGSHLNEAELVAGVEAGACGFIRRSDANPDSLSSAVASVGAGNGWLPDDMIGSLMAHISQLGAHGSTQNGLNLASFSERELQVLRLVAAGHETAEIARVLCYSERTVKGVIHEITTRFKLRNRAEAVAYAVRQGVI